MLKRIMIGCFSFMLATFLYAEGLSKSKTFVGLEGGTGTVYNGVTTLLGNISDTDNDTTIYGIRFGAETEEWRSMVIFDYEENDANNQDVTKGLVSVDYFIANTDYSEVVFKPYLGLNVGYAQYQASSTATGTVSVEEAGLLYGGQAGISIGLYSMIDIDFLYRYSVVDIDEVDHTENFILGLNYFF
ncbi:MAG: hypothetical protein DRQ78_11085 [Epsilonproteobacteria bacterium]|nr:MAG: hypothetical protein DRQ78_11085 [Campylobacterota bacterium]